MNVSLNIRATQMAGCEASPTHNWEATSHFESRYIRSATAKHMVQHKSVSGSIIIFFLLESHGGINGVSTPIDNLHK